MTAAELKSWRLALCVTQSRAGELLGISRKSYGELETGVTAIDRRTELACQRITLGQSGELPAGWSRRWLRIIRSV